MWTDHECLIKWSCANKVRERSVAYLAWGWKDAAHITDKRPRDGIQEQWGPRGPAALPIKRYWVYNLELLGFFIKEVDTATRPYPDRGITSPTSKLVTNTRHTDAPSSTSGYSKPSNPTGNNQFKSGLCSPLHYNSVTIKIQRQILVYRQKRTFIKNDLPLSGWGFLIHPTFKFLIQKICLVSQMKWH